MNATLSSLLFTTTSFPFLFLLTLYEKRKGNFLIVDLFMQIKTANTSHQKGPSCLHSSRNGTFSVILQGAPSLLQFPCNWNSCEELSRPFRHKYEKKFSWHQVPLDSGDRWWKQIHVIVLRKGSHKNVSAKSWRKEDFKCTMETAGRKPLFCCTNNIIRCINITSFFCYCRRWNGADTMKLPLCSHEEIPSAISNLSKAISLMHVEN